MVGGRKEKKGGYQEGAGGSNMKLNGMYILLFLPITLPNVSMSSAAQLRAGGVAWDPVCSASRHAESPASPQLSCTAGRAENKNAAHGRCPPETHGEGLAALLPEQGKPSTSSLQLQLPHSPWWLWEGACLPGGAPGRTAGAPIHGLHPLAQPW